MENTTAPTYEPVAERRDRAAIYADLVRAALLEAAEPLSAKELGERCKLSERLVRDGIERLVAVGAVEMRQRFVAHRRGLPPTVYALRARS